jgi:hypothetical protein
MRRGDEVRRTARRAPGPRGLGSAHRAPPSRVSSGPQATAPRAPQQRPRRRPGPCSPATRPAPPPPRPKDVPVVVKAFGADVIATPEDFRELLMEAGKLAQLDHP